MGRPSPSPAPSKPWPAALPLQSDNQFAVHEAWWDERQAIITAVHEGFQPGERRLALRMAECCHGGGLAVDPDAGRVWAWVDSCKSRHCPRCANVKYVHVVDHVTRIVARIPRIRFLTFTRKHTDAPLFKQERKLKAAVRRFLRRPVVKRYIDGGVWALEVKRNPKTGQWHAHDHLAYDGRYFPHRLIKRTWLEVTGDSYVVDVRAIDNAPAAARELTKYIAKPAQLAAWPPAQIREYIKAVRGTRMFGTFGTCYNSVLKDGDPLPKPGPNTYHIPAGRLITRAAQGVPTAVELALAFAELSPPFADRLYHHCPQLEALPHQSHRLRWILHLLHEEHPGITTSGGPPAPDNVELQLRLMQLCSDYRAQEAAGDFDVADWQHNRQYSPAP